MRDALPLALFLGALVSLLPGCQSCDGSGGVDDPRDQEDLAAPDLMPRPTEGRIVGRVFDVMAEPHGVVREARVEVVGGPSTMTDEDGRFVLEKVKEGRRLLLSISPPARSTYGSTQLMVSVVGGATTQAAPRLLRGCRGMLRLADMATTVELGQYCTRPAAYASLAIPAAGLARADGSTFSGDAVVEIIPVPFPQPMNRAPDLSYYEGLPGDMSAVQRSGAAVSLESLGAVEVRLVDSLDGKPLQVATGKRLTLQTKVFRAPVMGEQYSAWWYDTTRGLWVEEEPVRFKTVGGHQVGEVSVSHLTWWNIDKPLPEKTCVRGKVQFGGSPALGASIMAIGIDYGGQSASQVDTDGSFCFDVRPASKLSLTGYYRSDLLIDYLLQKPVMSGAAGISCGTSGACLDVGTLTMDPVAKSCAVGRVKVVGVPGVDPVSVYGIFPVEPARLEAGSVTEVFMGQVKPGADSKFCIELPSAEYRFSCDSKRYQVTGTKTGICGGDPAQCEPLGDINIDCGG